MIKLEVGIKLDKKQSYYEKILKEHNALNCFNFEVRDVYFTNKNLDGMSENEMKNACVRLRIGRCIGGKDIKILKKIKIFFGIKGKWSYEFQNYNIFDKNEKDRFNVSSKQYMKIINKLESNGYNKVFDTYKKDYQYVIGNMKSRIQLQNIKDIGLLLYYDNPDLYNLDEEEQRNKLIDELNSYGFDIKYDTLGLDKLRTLYYKKEMFSKNQNS